MMMGGRQQGKSLATARAFLEHCKKGDKIIYAHKDYVSMPRKEYDALVKKQVAEYKSLFNIKETD